ncbi:hypothetical protein [Acidisphaera sp. S103]|uniref:hypothetical protein n=1 Tax=Acidisphaera sp. S103 TaxID=1747223 RepID=UPI00131AD409|nr:hypothetical protein [Acidisphaera sp. S103]
MRGHSTLSLMALCLLSACNQPAVTPKAPAFQSSENTIRDWDNVAHEIADDMASHALLPPTPPMPAPQGYSTKPVFVRVQAPGSAFVREVAGELEADILSRGGSVSRTPTGATVVNLDVDFVAWSPRDKPPGLVGTMAGLASLQGTLIGASVPMSRWTAADAAAFSAIGVGAAADMVVALTPTSNTEAIWQASVVTSDQVVMRLQEPVYVRNRDIPLYAKTANLMPVASWSAGDATLAPRLLHLDP